MINLFLPNYYLIFNTFCKYCVKIRLEIGQITSIYLLFDFHLLIIDESIDKKFKVEE